jgi:hypothetical protein
MMQFEFDQMVEDLEEIVDRTQSFDDVLEALADVCRLKAEHIRTNWQDEGLAEGWDRQAKRVEKAIA